jgi:hypothetical protein
MKNRNSVLYGFYGFDLTNNAKKNTRQKMTNQKTESDVSG